MTNYKRLLTVWTILSIFLAVLFMKELVYGIPFSIVGTIMTAFFIAIFLEFFFEDYDKSKEAKK